MKKILITLLSLVLVKANALDMVFDKRPLIIPLVTNQETILSFDEQLIDFDIQNKDTKQKLNVLWTPENVLYITPTDIFKKTRVIASFASGQTAILDLTTSSFTKDKDINISLAKDKKAAEAAKLPKNLALMPDFLKEGYTDKVSNKVKISYKTMSQFAFRHFTGPSRLINADIPATKTSFKTKVNTRELIRVWSDRLSIKGLSQWQIGNHYVMATLVSNKSYKPYRFDPRAIRGDFQFIATLHDVIDVKGSYNDQTIWVFIADKPFNQVVGR